MQQCESLLEEFHKSAFDTIMEACEDDLDELEIELKEFNNKRDDGMEPSKHALGDGKAGQERQLTMIQKAELGKAREQTASDFAYTVAAARRSEQRRILSFIRMADYMVCDTLQTILLESVREVLAATKAAKVDDDDDDNDGGGSDDYVLKEDDGMIAEDEAKATGPQSSPLFRISLLLEDGGQSLVSAR